VKTITTTPTSDSPISHRRSSVTVECPGSGATKAKGSSNAVIASSKARWCLRRLAAAFRPSQSNLVYGIYRNESATSSLTMPAEKVPPARFERTAPGLGSGCGPSPEVPSGYMRARFLDSRLRHVTPGEVSFCQGGKLVGSDLVARQSQSAARCWRAGRDRTRATDLARTLHQPTKLRRRDAGVLQDLRQELRPDLLGFVNGEEQRPPVGVCQEAMTAASANLMEASSHKRAQDTPGRQLGKSRHRSGGNFDLDRHHGLSGRLLPHAAQRIDVELQRALCTGDGLTPRSSVHVAAGNLGDRRNKAPIGLALDGDDVAELHGAHFGRGRRLRQRAFGR